MKRTHVLSLLFWTLLASAACNVLQSSESTENEDQSNEPQAAHNGFLGGINSEKSRDISAALKEVIESGNWDRFTVAPVTHSDCHVEVQVVQKIPGRCIQLGKHRVPACQTQSWVSFNNEDCDSRV